MLGRNVQAFYFLTMLNGIGFHKIFCKSNLIKYTTLLILSMYEIIPKTAIMIQEKTKFRKLLHYLNFPELILICLMGKNHPMWLRFLLGAAFMYLGTKIGHIEFYGLAEPFGALVHATGATPILDALLEYAEETV